MKPVGYYKEKLENRQRELEARLHKIEDSLEEPVNPDVEDRATERENDEVLEGLGGAGQGVPASFAERSICTGPGGSAAARSNSVSNSAAPSGGVRRRCAFEMGANRAGWSKIWCGGAVAVSSWASVNTTTGARSSDA